MSDSLPRHGCSLPGLSDHGVSQARMLEWGQEEKGMTEDEIAGWHH